ncbi:MAG: multidrug resistance protein [Chloroflexi bacterium]|nr:multidrug resistance protein [Chloroflexota bacterium]MDL1882382.1 multidrug resistance protein [Anaerolineae bacterium CFX8]
MAVLKTDHPFTIPENPKTTSANLQSVGLVLASVACGAVGQLVLKAAMNGLGQLQPSLETLVAMATSPLLLVGIGIFGISTLLWLLALIKADLSFAYPFLSLTYIAVLIGGAVLFHEQVTLDRVLGFAVIVTGVWIVARSEKRSA